ncbi:hypothetical protein FRB93_010633 [Tulasnella sp. JGI-2019a]|nr:hypothetical protein FRB93_010633 [Tulasnella sp. JGI-2019a]
METYFGTLSKVVEGLLDLTDVPDTTSDDGNSEEDAYVPYEDSGPENCSGGSESGSTSKDSNSESYCSEEVSDEGDVMEQDEDTWEPENTTGVDAAANATGSAVSNASMEDAEPAPRGHVNLMKDQSMLRLLSVPELERHRSRVQAQIAALMAVEANIKHLIDRRKAREIRLPGLGWAQRHHDALRRQNEKPKTPNNFPVELLGRVFLFGWTEDCLSGIVFSHVCLYWRSVALATPELWSSIDLTHKHYILSAPKGTSLAPSLSRWIKSGGFLTSSVVYTRKAGAQAEQASMLLTSVYCTWEELRTEIYRHLSLQYSHVAFVSVGLAPGTARGYSPNVCGGFTCTKPIKFSPRSYER